MAKKALGKGLGALIKKQSEAPAPNQSTKPVKEVDGQAVLEVPIDQVISSPLQPRKVFSEEAIEELADSIRQHGIIQPLIVRLVNGKYELIAGERRWRASKSIGLELVPILSREASDQDVLEMALIENLQRADLNAIEEAVAYKRLAHEFGLKHEVIARQVGKSRASVANSIRLLDLEESVQAMLSEQKISVGHAKAILGLKEQAQQCEVAQEVIAKKMTVRTTEKRVQNINAGVLKNTKNETHNQQHSELLTKLESRLSKDFSTTVFINHKGKKGKIEIPYVSSADLERVLELLGISVDDI